MTIRDNRQTHTHIHVHSDRGRQRERERERERELGKRRESPSLGPAMRWKWTIDTEPGIVRVVTSLWRIEMSELLCAQSFSRLKMSDIRIQRHIVGNVFTALRGNADAV